MASTKRRRRAFGWPGAVGLVISIALLWWTLHDIDPSEVLEHLRRARWALVLAFVATATLTFPLRTLRWRYLLSLDGEALALAPLWHATAIGFMANNLLPARAGEVARAYAISRMTSVRFSTAAGSIGAERMLDGLTLVALLVVAAAAGGFPSQTTVGGLTLGDIMVGAAAVFTVVFAVAVAAVHWPDIVLTPAEFVLGKLMPAKWASKSRHLMEGVLEGLHALRSWRRFGTVMLLSLVVWGVSGASFWLAIVAFDIDVPWTAAFLLQSLIAFGVAVPSSPGFFGPFEAVTRATLALYGVPAGVAVSYAVGYHLSTFVPITLLGLWSLSRAHLHLSDLREAGTVEPGTIERNAPATPPLNP